MNFKLPGISASKFSKGFILRKMKRSAEDNVWPVFETIGVDRFRKVIDNGIPLLFIMPQDKMPNTWKEMIEQGKQYGWINNVIADDDYLMMLPDWFATLVNRNQQSKAWYAREISSIKKLFFGVQ